MGIRRPSKFEKWRSAVTVAALKDHFDVAVAGSTATGRDGITAEAFRRNLSPRLRKMNADLRGGVHRFAAYKLILKSKGIRKEPREISLPSVNDRVALRAMAVALNTIEPNCSIELAPSKVASVIAAMETGKYTHYLKVDVVNFYPTIKHSWLHAVLKKLLRRDDLVHQYMASVTTPTLSASESHRGQTNGVGVPQGLAVSNGLAELAVAHVDHAMQRRDEIAYFRYVDDILILMVGDQSAHLWPALETQFRLAGLTIHALAGDENKSALGPISEGFEFLGYRFEWPRISVRRGSISRVEASLARTFTRYRYAVEGTPRRRDWEKVCSRKLEWHLNLIITGCRFENRRSGWLAYYSQIRHHQLLQHLDGIVNQQIQRQRRRGHSIGFVPKTFVDSYRFAASRRPDTTGFVPDFDSMTMPEMRRLLSDIFLVDAGQVGRWADADVAERFARKIRGVTKELDRDKSSY